MTAKVTKKDAAPAPPPVDPPPAPAPPPSQSASRGFAFVQRVAELVECLREELSFLDANPDRDGTAFAGGMAAALREVGARLADRNPHRLRWPLGESPTRLNDPTGLESTRALVEYLFACLRMGPGVDQELADVAHVWPTCEDKAEASALVDARDDARVTKKNATDLAAHAKRKDEEHETHMRAARGQHAGQRAKVEEAIASQRRIDDERRGAIGPLEYDDVDADPNADPNAPKVG